MITARTLTDEMVRALLAESCKCDGWPHECDSEIFNDCSVILDGDAYSETTGRRRTATEQEYADARMRIADVLERKVKNGG